MPSWTLGDILSQATAGIGYRSDIALSTASFWANEAAAQVWDLLPHNTKEGLAVSSTTSGENRIQLPTDFLAPISISNLSASGVDLLEATETDALDSSGTGLGTPTRYALYSDWLELYPSPDSSYSIQLRYDRLYSDMTELTSRPSIATRFRYAIMLKTKELLAQHVILDSEAANLARAEFISHMNMMPSDRALRQQAREGMHLTVAWRRSTGR